MRKVPQSLLAAFLDGRFHETSGTFPQHLADFIQDVIDARADRLRLCPRLRPDVRPHGVFGV